MLYLQHKNHHKELCEESWKICFFISTDFKARNFLIYKYILCLTEALEHKSFINICWMSELINESLRTIWRKHYNSIKSWAELKGEDQGKLEDHLEGSPREDTNQTVCWLLEDLAAWYAPHRARLKTSNRNKGKPAQVGVMAQEHRWTKLCGTEPKRKGKLEDVLKEI